MANITKIGSGTLNTPVINVGMTNGGIGTSTARPYSLAAMDVDTALTYEAINRKLQIESTLDSVFSDVGADVVFNGKKVSIPESCIMRVSSEKGARSQVMPIENPLTGPGQVGSNLSMMGYERQRTLQFMKIYYNEYAQGVLGEKYGMNYNDLQIFQYYAGEQPALSKWFAEDEDKQYHEALLETYSYVLEATGTSLKQNYNSNVFVANTEFGSMPAWSATPATYRGNINTALAAADTGTNGVNANLDLDQLIYIDYYAENYKRIQPVMVGGKKTYVCLVPVNQLAKMKAQLTSTLFTNLADLSPEEKSFTNVFGRVGNLLLIEDQRYPTVTCTNNYGDATHVVEYVEPGNDDSRNKAAYNAASNASWDIMLLMGKGALVDWTVTPLHYEMEETEYGRIYGKAAFAERGIQLGNTWDTDTAGNGNLKNYGSMAIFLSATSLVQTA